MPYVICEDCQLKTYSAALYSTQEECPRCGRRLSPRRFQRKAEFAAYGFRQPRMMLRQSSHLPPAG